jgi:outer membrane receptor protein involved in Fe transport
VGSTAAQNQNDQQFQMLKFSQKVGKHSTIELMSSRNHMISETFPGVFGEYAQWSDLQHDQELLHRIEWGADRFNTTYGVTYRNALSESVNIFSADPSQRLELWSGYFNQSIQLHKMVTLVGGASWEHSNVGGGGVLNNYQVASMFTPVKDQSLRISHGLAHTVPALFNAKARNFFDAVTVFEGNPALLPQHITTSEIGYRGAAMGRQLLMETGFFYTTIKNIDSTVFRSAVFFPQTLITLSADNLNQAIARGVETAFKYRFDRGHTLYVNHTYQHVTDWKGNTGEVTQNTPSHKVNFGGVANLGRISSSVNVGYKDNYFITSAGRSLSIAAPAYWRLDARVGYAVNSHVELFVAGQNLLSPRHLEFADLMTVPRTYQGGVTLKFGGRS